jgi:hypothetical protein
VIPRQIVAHGRQTAGVDAVVVGEQDFHAAKGLITRNR